MWRISLIAIWRSTSMGGGLDGVGAAQLRAALTLNQETILLYWSIGQDLASRFAAEGWGTKEMVWPLC